MHHLYAARQKSLRGTRQVCGSSKPDASSHLTMRRAPPQAPSPSNAKVDGPQLPARWRGDKCPL
jgi:hypothetical protein